MEWGIVTMISRVGTDKLGSMEKCMGRFPPRKTEEYAYWQYRRQSPQITSCMLAISEPAVEHPALFGIIVSYGQIARLTLARLEIYDIWNEPAWILS